MNRSVKDTTNQGIGESVSALVSSLANVESTRIAIPEIQLSVRLLDFAASTESTVEVDDKLVARKHEVVFDRDSMSNELVVRPIDYDYGFGLVSDQVLYDLREVTFLLEDFLVILRVRTQKQDISVVILMPRGS